MVWNRRWMGVAMVIVGAALLILRVTAATAAPDEVRVKRPDAATRQSRVTPGAIKLACANPATAEIKFEVVSRDPATRWKGKVRITGVVKNIGTKATARGFGIYLKVPNKILASKLLPTLAAGATDQVAYEMNWDSSSPSEGEFPPTFTLYLLGDPDLGIDQCNTDAARKDDTMTRSGADINKLFKS